MKTSDSLPRFSAEEIEAEIKNENKKRRFRKYIRNTLYVITGIAAAAVMIATLVLPVVRVYNNSMSPGITEGEILVSVRLPDFKRGDVIAFYYNNRILVKRVIGQPGDLVEVKEDGTVLVNNETIDEPYVSELTFGQCDVEFPVRVNEETYFVLGDNRADSVDSRSEAVGLVKKEDIMGKVFLTVFPFDRIGAH